MDIRAIVPCVEYDDFLALTLPHNLALLPSLTVLTSPIDQPTIALATRLGARVYITDAWHIGGPLNKANALNEWLDRTTQEQANPWLLVLDADIFLPATFFEHLDRLDLEGRLNPRSLYSARRRMCHDRSALKAYLEGDKPLTDFPYDIPTTLNKEFFGDLPLTNLAGLAGYLHLWSPQHAVGDRRFPVTGTAEGYDLQFALSFPEENRAYLDPLELLHIGPTFVNWHGRKSPRWG